MNEDPIGVCWNCQRPLTTAEYGREDACLDCGKATRVCRNCRRFEPGRPDDCDEPMADAVLDKVRSNFCSFFEPTETVYSKQQTDNPTDLLKAAEDLFK